MIFQSGRMNNHILNVCSWEWAAGNPLERTYYVVSRRRIRILRRTVWKGQATWWQLVDSHGVSLSWKSALGYASCLRMQLIFSAQKGAHTFCLTDNGILRIKAGALGERRDCDSKHPLINHGWIAVLKYPAARFRKSSVLSLLWEQTPG